MQWRMVKVMDSILKDSVWYNDDEMFTLTKLFSFNEKTNSFIHEGHVDTFLKCKKFIDDVNSEGTMIIDSYHLWKSGGETDDFLGYDKNKISVLHISDADKNINRQIA